MLLSVKETFERMAGRFLPERAAGVSGIVRYEISGPDGGTWHASIRDGACAVTEGPGPEPTLTVQISDADWLAMVSGQARGDMLFMSGRLKTKGDMSLAMRLSSFFQPWGAS